ncbi:diacylglycerol/lipid kinase family protein [Cellulomonas bogoriensis]|uniref:Diacylglycerol kinase n=1 Tax=Cellulomonas bogoriensis 69B4 = DSM 16987 TaxID=1386082 RepID=A0A0A0BX34_9CELL|nr:diacylglycerol kinase family protein [Cellulomonas bogoriensis]KGM12968.1 diacylglycerol kinase [Cellulomonas bogoriensis 69B4 = DSM 16987]
MTWVEWVAVAALLLATVAVVLAVLNRRALVGHGVPVTPSAGAPGAPGSAGDRDDATRTQVAFVANPTKPGVAALRDQSVQACAARYLPEPLWFDTTVEDPGVGQTREAVERGARVVVAIGGDGTVRAVAEGLTGTDASMGLIPQGTGNLLARNLDLPINDVEELLRIALTGRTRAVDVGWLRVLRDEAGVADDIAEADPEAVAPRDTPPATREPARDHIFLVIAGLGFDAAMVADTDEQLKAKVGWIAYFVAGVKHLRGRRMRLDIRVDGGPWRSVRLRSLLFGNVGRLPGGITLLPDAVLDDGVLDVAAIDTRGGIAGWAQLFGEVVMQRFGIRNDLPNKIGRIDHLRARTVRVRSRDAQQLQVDGETIGSVREVSARVDRQALRIRVPDRRDTTG